MLLAAILSGAAVSAAPQVPYPAEAIIGAFSAVCSSPTSESAVRSQAEAEGWQSVVDPNDRVSKILTNGMALGKAYPGVNKFAVLGTATLRKTVESRNLELAVDEIQSEVGGNAFRATGCYVYDVDASAPIDDAILLKSVGRMPDRSVTQPGVLIARIWDDGKPLTKNNFEAAYAPPESPYVRQELMAGVILISRQIEKTKQ